MNERIKELANKAGYDDVFYEISREGLDKLVKLAVLECANLCYERAYAGTQGSFSDAALICSRDIKKHFGVEE